MLEKRWKAGAAHVEYYYRKIITVERGEKKSYYVVSFNAKAKTRLYTKKGCECFFPEPFFLSVFCLKKPSTQKHGGGEI